MKMLLLAPLTLLGCAETHPADPDKLQAWMHNERQQHVLQAPPKPTLAAEAEHLASPKLPHRMDTQPHDVEPFSPQRLLFGLPDKAPQAAVTPQLAQTPSPTPSPGRPTLDALPLAGMRLIGSVQRGDQSLALLRVQGLVYSVRVGDKIGQDQGRVSAITMTGLVLRERTLDAAGQHLERVVSLALVQEPR
jgi:type IV pilus assembly protein PilP